MDDRFAFSCQSTCVSPQPVHVCKNPKSVERVANKPLVLKLERNRQEKEGRSL